MLTTAGVDGRFRGSPNCFGAESRGTPPRSQKRGARREGPGQGRCPMDPAPPQQFVNPLRSLPSHRHQGLAGGALLLYPPGNWLKSRFVVKVMTPPRVPTGRVSPNGPPVRIRRNKVLVTLPAALFGCLIVNLVWEMIRRNLESRTIGTWPWRLTLLDLPTTANLAVLIGGLIVARNQFAKTHSAIIGTSGDTAPKSLYVNAQWVAHIKNSGPGLCFIDFMQFRYRLREASILDGHASRWMDWGEIILELKRNGLKHGRDYQLNQLGSGSVVPGSSVPYYEIAAWTGRAMRHLSGVDMHIRYRDVLGDSYEMVHDLMYTAHQTLQLEETVIARYRDGLLRRRSDHRTGGQV
jgi:hypothetical protein